MSSFSTYTPYIEFVFNKEFIAKVLCINKDKPELKCNGKCHLKKQVKENSDKEQEKKSTIPVNERFEFSKYLNNGLVEVICFEYIGKTINPFIANNYSYTFIFDITHPPD